MLKQHPQESHIGDNVAGREGRSYVECQIFSSKTFPDVPFMPKNYPEWGFHPEDNTVDVIDPYQLYGGKRHFMSWDQVRTAGSRPEDGQMLEELSALQNRKPGTTEYYATRKNNRAVLSRLIALAGKSTLGEDPRILRNWLAGMNAWLDRPKSLDQGDRMRVLTEDALARVILSRALRHLRVLSPPGVSVPNPHMWHVLVPLIADRQIAPSGLGILIPAPGHPSNPPAYRQARVQALARMPFDLCGGDAVGFPEPGHDRIQQRRVAEYTTIMTNPGGNGFAMYQVPTSQVQ